MRRPRSRPLLGPLAVVVAFSAAFLAPGRASAIVSDVQPIDGPGADVVDVADAAMAEDGSGGIVYLKLIGGRPHVFAAQFRDGAWRAPQRVDIGQEFESSWPRIGAGDGGRLVVTWVQEFGAGDRMFSASLDPGASSFLAPVPIDFNVGEASATFPDLAMNRGGQAYLVYRVVTDVSTSNPPGYVGADTRVARYNGRLWSVLGTPVDRNVGTPVLLPTAENSPKVGIDVQGGGVVAWQEPDDEFVDRVWARRLFGATFGIPLQASPSTWAGLPLRGPADAFALDVSGFGQAAVAIRQQPGQAGALDAARILVDELPDVFSESAGSFFGPHLADGGSLAELGAPGVAVDPRGLYVAAFSSGPATLLGSGHDAASDAVERLDDGGSGIPGEPLTDLAETGAGVVVWRELRAGAGSIGVQERRADGVVEPSALRAPRGGAVGRVVLGGSGLGDAIVAWQQGDGDGSQVSAAVIDAPPDPFLVLLPEGWQRKPRIGVAWDRARNANGRVRYSISVDDEPVVEDRHGLRATLTRDDVDDGRHRIQVFAVDSAGQETGSRVGPLMVDRGAPSVKLRKRGLRLTVVVADDARASGVRGGSVKVSFGDGSTGSKDKGGRGGGPGVIAAAKKKKKRPVVRRAHTYERGGSYRVRVRARDKAGNVLRYSRKVGVG
jgi:hypothetical protein